MASGQALAFSQQTAEILERMSDGFYAIDRDWNFIYVNRTAELFWALRREDMLGRNMLELFPRFPGSEPHRAHLKVFEQGIPLCIETVSTVNATPVELDLHPATGGLYCFFHNISDRLQLERRLRDRDEMLAQAELHAGVGVWDVDLVSRILVGTPQLFRLHGLQPALQPVPADTLHKLRHPEDAVRVADDFAARIGEGSDAYEAEYRIVRPDGQMRWILSRGRVVRDPAGIAIRYSGIDLDVTERKAQEDRLRVVTHELRHRANNLLAVVQAMARQTIRASSDLDDFERRFEGRVRALADSNELLVTQDWKGVTVRALVEKQLRPFVEADTQRLRANGPDVSLSHKAVETLGLALHELATNASKYGALSVPSGHLDVVWTIARGETPVLHLTWQEVDGPPVEAPTRSGFGRFVVETMVKANLDAVVVVEFRHDGMVWSAEIPLTESNGGSDALPAAS